MKKPKRKSKPKTISRSELFRLATCNGRKLPSVINDCGVRYRWVGIGWVDEGKPTGREVVVTEDKE